MFFRYDIRVVSLGHLTTSRNRCERLEYSAHLDKISVPNKLEVIIEG